MTQETAPSVTEEAATPTEAPAAPTQRAAPEPEVEATPTPEATPAEPEAAVEEAPAEPPSFTEMMTGYGADDSPHKEDLSRYNDDQQGQGWQRALDTLQPQVQANKERAEANAKLYGDASQQLATMNGRVDKLVREGNLTEDTLADAIKSVPGAWSALESIGENLQESAKKSGQEQGMAAGTYAGAEFFIEQGSKAIGKPSLHDKFSARLEASKRGQDDSTKIVHDFIKAVRQYGYDDGLASKTAENKASADVKEREGQKPPQGVGGAGGAAMTRQQLTDMSPDDPNMPGPAERARIFGTE